MWISNSQTNQYGLCDIGGTILYDSLFICTLKGLESHKFA